MENYGTDNNSTGKGEFSKLYSLFIILLGLFCFLLSYLMADEFFGIYVFQNWPRKTSYIVDKQIIVRLRQSDSYVLKVQLEKDADSDFAFPVYVSEDKYNQKKVGDKLEIYQDPAERSNLRPSDQSLWEFLFLVPTVLIGMFLVWLGKKMYLRQ